MVDEATSFRRDRLRFRIHAATLLGGGLLAGLTGIFSPVMQSWLVECSLLASSAAVTLSGALAISIGRTMFSGPAGEDVWSLPDPHERPSDALDSPGLWSFGLCPEWSKSTAPFGLFLLGLIMLAASIYHAAI